LWIPDAQFILVGKKAGFGAAILTPFSRGESPPVLANREGSGYAVFAKIGNPLDRRGPVTR
jgi:hypothetical protein